MAGRNILSPTFETLESRFLLSAWWSDLVGSFASAETVEVGALDSVITDGQVEQAGGNHLYEFTAAADGQAHIDLAADGVGLDPYLEVFSSWGRRYGVNDNASDGTLDSHVTLGRVRAGDTYYIRAAGTGDTTGGYHLTVTSDPTDDCGNTFDNAKELRLWSRRGSASAHARGTVNYAGDVDMMAFVAAESGLVTITQQGWGRGRNPGLTGQVSAYDADGNLLATDDATDEANASVRFRVVAGQQYYTAMEGVGDATGYYTTTLTTLPEPFASAQTVDVEADDTVTVAGTLTEPGQAVAYTFTAKADGTILVDMAADGDGLDPYLELYRDPGQVWQRNDNASSETTDARLRIRVRAGDTYYVLAAGTGEDTGGYHLTVTSDPTDDCGNTFDNAKELRLWSRRGSASAHARGTVNYAGDVDMMAFVAAESGLVTITQQGWGRGRNPGLTGQVSAYDADGNLLATDDATDEANASVRFRVVAGQQYYTAMEGVGDATGYYTTTLTTLPEPFASAQTVDVEADDTVTVAGTLTEPGQAVAYTFTAKADGTILVDMAADGDGLDPYLELYRDPGQVWQRNDNASSETTDARLRIRVRAGDTYYVLAAGTGEATGGYHLTVTSDPTDDFVNTADEARPIQVNSQTGSAFARGSINYAGDLDVIALVAPKTGTMTVEQQVWGHRSTLSGELWIHNADGDLVGHDADAGDAGASLAFEVVGGHTYYATFGSLNNATGWYGVRIATDAAPTPDPNPGPDEFADAQTLDLTPTGRVTADGVIAAQTETDMYRLTAPADGYIDADMDADGGDIDAYLEVYDDRGRLLGQNDNGSTASRASRLSFRVRAGVVYYIRACGMGGTVGPYTLAAESDPEDDCGNTFQDGGIIRLNADTGDGHSSGKINYAGDVDMMSLTATQTGVMRVEQTVWGRNSEFSGKLTVYDADGNELAHDDDASDAAATISLSVTDGQTYYVGFEALDGTTGWYQVNVTTEAPAPPDPDPDPDPAPDPDPDPDPAPDPDPDPDPDPAPPDGGDYTPGVMVLAHVLGEGAELQLVIVGTDGADTITVSQTGNAISLTTPWGTTTYDGSFTSSVVYGFGGADTIRLNHTVTTTSQVYGGTGDDQLFEAGPGAGWIYGQAGDDLLVTVGGGLDRTYGGIGLDSFWLDSTDALADIEIAEILATSVHQVTAFYQPTGNPAEHVSLEIAGQDIVDPAASSSYYNHYFRPLFVDGPEYNDVRQGSVGDCYFLASLASLADTDPGTIRQMIAPMGDGTFAVRYYRNGQPVYLRIDAELPGGSFSPRYAKLTPDGELWVALAEKAYAQFRYGDNSYASISGGWMDIVYREVTGGATTRLWPTSSSVATSIAGHLAAGHAVTLASKSSPPGPIVGLHAYMVKSVEINAGTTYVTVYNPWGVDGKPYDSNAGDGLLQLTLADFRANFSTVVVSLA